MTAARPRRRPVLPVAADPVVFGPGYMAALAEAAAELECGDCGTRWAMTAGPLCWLCGLPPGPRGIIRDAMAAAEASR